MFLSVQWFPPSWVIVHLKGKRLVVDPAYLKTYYKGHPGNVVFSSWPDPVDGLPEAMGKADWILVTHSHKDHCKRVTVNRLSGRDTRVIAPERCRKELGGGLEPVQPGDALRLGPVSVKAVDAYNTKEGRSTKKQHKKGEGVGYMIGIEGRTIYHAGDTDFIPEMRGLGPVDVALLPIGGTYTMDLEEAVDAAVVLNPAVVIPMHRFEADPQAFAEAVERCSRIRAMPLDIGEVCRLSPDTGGWERGRA